MAAKEDALTFMLLPLFSTSKDFFPFTVLFLVKTQLLILASVCFALLYKDRSY